MKLYSLKKLAVAIIAPVAFSAFCAPAALAEESTILAGDEALETWIGEIQAEILFDAHLERAETLGDKAIKRAEQVWGEMDDSNAYHHQYVILHTLLATINLRRDQQNIDKNALMTSLTSAMEGQAILSSTDVLTRDEENITKILVDVTRARIECRFGGNRAKDRAYNTVIKKLKKIDGKMLDQKLALLAAYKADDDKYENLTPDERPIMELNDMITDAVLEQIQQEGVIAHLEEQRDYCAQR